MSMLTRDGTAEPILRDQILRREEGQGNQNWVVLAWIGLSVENKHADAGRDGRTYWHVVDVCDTGTIRGGSWVGFRTWRFVLAYIITNEQTKFHLGCEI